VIINEIATWFEGSSYSTRKTPNDQTLFVYRKDKREGETALALRIQLGSKWELAKVDFVVGSQLRVSNPREKEPITQPAANEASIHEFYREMFDKITKFASNLQKPDKPYFEDDAVYGEDDNIAKTPANDGSQGMEELRWPSDPDRSAQAEQAVQEFEVEPGEVEATAIVPVAEESELPSASRPGTPRGRSDEAPLTPKSLKRKQDSDLFRSMFQRRRFETLITNYQSFETNIITPTLTELQRKHGGEYYAFNLVTQKWGNKGESIPMLILMSPYNTKINRLAWFTPNGHIYVIGEDVNFSNQDHVVTSSDVQTVEQLQRKIMTLFVEATRIPPSDTVVSWSKELLLASVLTPLVEMFNVQTQLRPLASSRISITGSKITITDIRPDAKNVPGGINFFMHDNTKPAIYVKLLDNPIEIVLLPSPEYSMFIVASLFRFLTYALYKFDKSGTYSDNGPKQALHYVEHTDDLTKLTGQQNLLLFKKLTFGTQLLSLEAVLSRLNLSI